MPKKKLKPTSHRSKKHQKPISLNELGNDFETVVKKLLQVPPPKSNKKGRRNIHVSRKPK